MKEKEQEKADKEKQQHGPKKAKASVNQKKQKRPVAADESCGGSQEERSCQDTDKELAQQRQRLEKARISAHQKDDSTGVTCDEDSDGSQGGSEGSSCQCPKCGLIFGEEDTLWVCCDGCDCWYDLKCTNLKRSNIPDFYWCENCN